MNSGQGPATPVSSSVTISPCGISCTAVRRPLWVVDRGLAWVPGGVFSDLRLPLTSSPTWSCPFCHCSSMRPALVHRALPCPRHCAEPCVVQGPVGGSILIKAMGERHCSSTWPAFCLGVGALRGGWPGFPRASMARPESEVSAGRIHPRRALLAIMWKGWDQTHSGFFFFLLFLSPLNPSKGQRGRG